MAELQRVQKIIANNSDISRRKAEELIDEGKVKVNGKIITLGDKATEQDNITINDKPISTVEKITYIMNKPKGFITTTEDPKERDIVTNLVPNNPRVYPAGRLDRDTTGILLLTNDGDFANDLTHPSKHVEKSYLVELDKDFDIKDSKKIKEGIELEEGLIKGRVEDVNKNIIILTINLGWHKVVKRIMKAIGYYVHDLSRIRIGNYVLPTVHEGEYKLMDEEEKQLLLSKKGKTPVLKIEDFVE